jgi:hypothetical protein
VVQAGREVPAVPDGPPLNMVLTREVPAGILLWGTWEVLVLDRDGPPLNMVLTREVPAGILPSETQDLVRVPVRSGPTSEAIPLSGLRARVPDRLSSGRTPAGRAIPDSRTSSDVGGDVRITSSTRQLSRQLPGDLRDSELE